MAFTKVTNAGIGSTGTVLLHNLNVVGTVTATDGIFSGIGSFGGNVSVGGTLTYEDVTNIDSVGLITARNGINVIGAGVTIRAGGLNVTSGVSTFSGNVKVGTGITLSPDGDIFATGVCTATSFVGSGANLTGIDATQIVTGNTSVQTVDTGSDGHVKVNIEGSERFRIDTSGKVLINTTTAGEATSDTLTINTLANHAGVTIRSSTSGSGCIYFADGTSGNAQYRGFAEYVHSSDFLKFGTAGTERLRITGDGPHLLLGGTADVNEITESASNTGMVIGSTSLGNGGLAIINSTSGTGRIYFGDATGSSADRNRGQINYYHNGDYMMFGTAGSERLRITSDEKFGFGCSDPQTTIHASAVDGGIWLGNPLGDGFQSGRNPTLKIQSDCSEKLSYIDTIWGGDNNYDRSLTFGGTYVSLHSPGASAGAETLRVAEEKVNIGNYFVSKHIGDYTAALQVGGTNANSAAISINRWTNDAAGSVLQLFKGRGTSGGAVDKGQDGDVIGSIAWVQANNNNLNGQGNTARIDCNIDAAPGGGDYPGRITFWTCPDGSTTLQERLRINRNGQLSLQGDTDTYLDRNTTNTWQIHTNGTLCTEFSANQRVRMPQVYSTNGSSMRDVQVESDGTLCAGNTSIRASKINIKPQTDVSWLYDLVPSTFNYRKKIVDKENGNHTYLDEAQTETAYGLIAEEVETVNQDFCFYNDGELAGVSYNQLITPLLKALQDQKKEIDTLKSEVATLKSS